MSGGGEDNVVMLREDAPAYHCEAWSEETAKRELSEPCQSGGACLPCAKLRLALQLVETIAALAEADEGTPTTISDLAERAAAELQGRAKILEALWKERHAGDGRTR